MTTINKQQALRRWDTLPDNLREFMFADSTTNAMDKIFSDLNIPENKQPAISRVVGHVLMGFIHPEDAAKEIQDATNINAQHARELADSINLKIFSPFRAVLEKIYALPETEQIAPSRPTLDSILAPKSVPADLSAPRSLESLAAKSSATTILPSETKTTPATPTKTKPSFTAAPAALPNFSTLPSFKSATVPSPVAVTPAAPKPMPAPAPFVIQTETKVQPITQAPKFTMESLGKAVSAFGTRAPASAAPPKMAQVEIGNLPKRTAAPSGVVAKYESAPRVIHYGGPSTPLPGSPTNSSFGPVSMSSLQGGASLAPKSTPPPTAPSSSSAPSFLSSSPLKPPIPIPAEAGGFIKTMIAPKNEGGVGSVSPPLPKK